MAFIMIDSLSVNQNVYFTENGGLTQKKEEALVVESIDQGFNIAQSFTIYKPVFQPIK